MSIDIDKAFKQWSDSNPARTFEDAFSAGVAYGKSAQDDYWARFKDHEIRDLRSQLKRLQLKLDHANEKYNKLTIQLKGWCDEQ